MTFQIRALAVDQFSHLFGKDEDELERLGVKRVLVDSMPGFPCRVSLQDAEVGESVLLMNYEHQAAASPFRSSHAIYVREEAIQAKPAENGVPEVLRRRILSLRAFDDAGMMVDADVVDGQKIVSVIDRMFGDDSVAYIHVHNAKMGCYAAWVERSPCQSLRGVDRN